MGGHWIVGVDGSAASVVALDWALRQAQDRHVDVDVVLAQHVTAADRLVGAVTGRGRDEPTDDPVRKLEATTADIVGDRAVRHRVLSGSPGRVLVDAARDADLLVVGRHGAGGWRHALGSVSRYCVTHSATPAVVVPAEWSAAATHRVVVGFDGSANAAAALRWAMSFVGPDVELIAVVAIEVAPWLQEDIVHVRLGEEVQAEERRLVELLDAADPDHRARREITVCDARPALARAADRADLVVLGAHGAGRLGTAVMGSVSTWMLDGSPAPIAVVPAPDDRSKGTD